MEMKVTERERIGNEKSLGNAKPLNRKNTNCRTEQDMTGRNGGRQMGKKTKTRERKQQKSNGNDMLKIKGNQRKGKERNGKEKRTWQKLYLRK